MEEIGIVLRVKEEEQFGASGFRKREIHIETEDQYPQKLSFEFVQDKCDLLDGFQPGMKVKIAFNLRGREWTDPSTQEVKVFNTVQGWRIEQTQ